MCCSYKCHARHTWKCGRIIHKASQLFQKNSSKKCDISFYSLIVIPHCFDMILAVMWDVIAISHRYCLAFVVMRDVIATSHHVFLALAGMQEKYLINRHTTHLLLELHDNARCYHYTTPCLLGSCGMVVLWNLSQQSYETCQYLWAPFKLHSYL